MRRHRGSGVSPASDSMRATALRPPPMPNVRRIRGSAREPCGFLHGKVPFHSFSRERSRIHVPARSGDGAAGLRLDPAVDFAGGCSPTEKDRSRGHTLIGEHKDEIRAA